MQILITPSNKLLWDKITRILEPFTPTAVTDDTLSVIYQEVDNIVDIYAIKESDDYYLKTKTGTDLQQKEIDDFISLKLRESIALPRVQTNGSNSKFESITTTSNGPSASYGKIKIDDLPLAKKMEIGNELMTQYKPKIESMSDDEFKLHWEKLQQEYNFCREIAQKRNLAVFRRNIGESDSDYQSRLERKNDLKKRKELRAARARNDKAKKHAGTPNKTLTDEQKKMKAMGMDYNKPEEIARYRQFLASLSD